MSAAHARPVAASWRETVSEILLSVLAEVLGAALLALVMAAVKRARGVARA